MLNLLPQKPFLNLLLKSLFCRFRYRVYHSLDTVFWGSM